MKLARLLLAFCALATALVPGASAWAHATLVLAIPSDGAVLEQSPAKIVLRFNEAITPLIIRLLDPAGHPIDSASVRAVNDTIEIQPAEALRRGTHTVSYRIISADGHPVGGALTFSVGQTSATATVPTQLGGRAIAIWLSRLLYYLALLCGAGGAIFLVLTARASPQNSARRRLHWLLASTAAIAIVCLALQGLDMLDLGVAGLLEAKAWIAAMRSTYGATIALALCACMLAALALARDASTRTKVLALATLAATGASFAASGHASTASPQWLMRAAVFVHLVAVTLLAGPLLALVGVLPLLADQRSAALRRIRGVALFGFLALCASGAILAIVQISSVAAITNSSYGWLFLAKLVGILGLLIAFAVNRAALAPAARRGSATARRWARRTISLQFGLFVCVLAITAGWRFTPPPRALADVQRIMHIHTDKMMAMVTFKPAGVGANSAHIELQTGDFGETIAKEVRLIAWPVDGAIEPLERQARHQPDGAWVIDDLHIAYAGKWNIQVEALVSDFDKIAIEDTFVFN